MPLVTQHIFRGRNIHIKRDDLLFFQGISGNKIRKFQYFLDYGVKKDCILSYGGHQSNAMVALSKIAKHLEKPFYYVTKSLSNVLRCNPVGNLKLSLHNNMQLLETSDEEYKRFANQEGSFDVEPILQQFPQIQSSSIAVIPQGGFMKESSHGISRLGDEMAAYMTQNNSSNPWKVIVASGTGTIAYFLAQRFAKRFPEHRIEVIAVPCVGNEDVLANQIRILHQTCGDFVDLSNSGSSSDSDVESNKDIRIPYSSHLKILSTSNCVKRQFAQPSRHLLDLWRELTLKTEIQTWDLIYAPRTWEILLSNSYWNGNEYVSLLTDVSTKNCELLYYHCGGSEGNESQMQRYHYLRENHKLKP